jgi:PAS domain S-box-containing protein
MDERSTLYSLFMEAPAIIAVFRGPNHIFELVNPAYQRFIGDRDVIGRPAAEAMPELKERGSLDRLDQVFRTGQSLAGRDLPVLLDRTGSDRLEQCFFNFVYQPIRREDGSVEGVIVFAFDVTEEVRAKRLAEELMEQQRAASRAFEDEMSIFVDAVRDYAIFRLDRDGRVATWNAGAERIKGYPASEILGRHYSIFYPDADVRDGKPERDLQSAVERGSIQEEGWRVRKDGSLFWADTLLTAVFNDDDSVRGFVKVTRDITERKNAEETQRALSEQRFARLQAEEKRRLAEESARAKDEFIAMISHELRTPLTSILGWARMLRMGTLDAATTAEALDALERSAQAQVHLVEDLLDTARITSGKLRLDKRPLDLRSVVEAAIADVVPSAEAKGIRITTDLECDCSLLGDPTRLQQVVWNLLTNAIKFTPDGGSVMVRMKESSPMAVVEFRDTGLGIDPELLPNLFTRYKQGDPAAKDRRGGLGLGLSLSRHLAELHGGTIEASSEGRGKGSTFTLRLPLTSAAADRLTQRNDDRDSDLPRLDSVRLLIVEDEADNREMLSEVAKQCGADVRSTSTAQAALELIERWRPDAIVSDIALPDLDGCQFLERVRATSFEHIPALALTVLGAAAEESRIRAAGFEVFRQKPIEPADFAHDIARLVAGTNNVPA